VALADVEPHLDRGRKVPLRGRDDDIGGNGPCGL
jgi:hypothetical protein